MTDCVEINMVKTKVFRHKWCPQGILYRRYCFPQACFWNVKYSVHDFIWDTRFHLQENYNPWCPRVMLCVGVLRMVCDAYWQRTSKYIRLSPVKFWLFASDISLSLSNVNFELETDAKISFSSVIRSIILLPTIAIDPKVWVSRSPASILPSWTRYRQHLAPWSSRICLFTKQFRLTLEDTLVQGDYKGSTMHVFLLF